MLKPNSDDLQTLNHFLRVATPPAWIEKALENIPSLLVDHAHCERKAAASALNFISKYPEKPEIIDIMAPLAREELLHFEKVMSLIRARGYAYGPLTPSIYAQKLHKNITQKDGKKRLADQLIVGAIIEARSCERFAALAPLFTDEELRKFYITLAKAEARHFQEYLRLAYLYCKEDVESRIPIFLDIENELILAKDPVFRFHSGIPEPI